jgi:uncharacterized low-complexity protein
MKTLSVLVLLSVAVAAVAVAAAGCADMLRSDSANAIRKNERANKEALAAAKAATGQAGAARPVAGDELARLLSGNTHVREYRKRTADAKPYFTIYEYFSPDGAYIVRDTYAQRLPGYQSKGRWRVNAEVLCLRERADSQEDKCFTVRVTPANEIEYWYHKPGDPYHGLIASSVSIVRPGPQEPEYTTTSSPYER